MWYLSNPTPSGSISTWEDLTTRFLAQFFPLRRIAKLRNDILMFQKHQRESLSEAWTRFKDLLQKVPYHGIDLWLQVKIFYDHVTPATRQTIDQAAGGKLRDKNAEESWEHAQTFTSSWNDSFSTYPSKFQMKLEKALIGFDSYQEKRLSSPRTQFGQQQDDMISKINLLWKTISKKLDDAPIRNTAGSLTIQMNLTSTNYPTKEELRGKGIKSPSKLLSPKYVSQSSLAEQNRNPSSLKRVHFVNLIVLLNKDDEAKEYGNVKSSTTEYKDHVMIVESEEEFEEETKEEIKEEEEDIPEHFDTFPTMNELRLHYNWIMSKRLEPRRKPSNPKKICNFVRRVKGLKVFVWSFTYKCDFAVLEDTTSVIDHNLGSIIFGKPFVEATRFVYDRREGTIAFEKDKEKIVFKMPHKMEMFKHIDFTNIKTNPIPPFVIESDDDNSEKTHYSDSLDLGPEYKYDENVIFDEKKLGSSYEVSIDGRKAHLLKDNQILSVEAEGIFIINADNSEEEHLRTQLNCDVVLDGIDVHCFASLIKAWFRELPTGVLDHLSRNHLMQCRSEEEFLGLGRLLPPMETTLLDWPINLMADVVHRLFDKSVNKEEVPMYQDCLSRVYHVSIESLVSI
nr:Rho GTPase-activating protein 5-like [Tanacetum cinerariifolium]